MELPLEKARKRDQRKIGDNKERAEALILKLSEVLNMKCPRCNVVFGDYDGCNALSCTNPICRAAFCAICLRDYGSDAHGCARSHGDLFDKNIFERIGDKQQLPPYAPNLDASDPALR